MASRTLLSICYSVCTVHFVQFALCSMSSLCSFAVPCHVQQPWLHKHGGAVGAGVSVRAQLHLCRLLCGTVLWALSAWKQHKPVCAVLRAAAAGGLGSATADAPTGDAGAV